MDLSIIRGNTKLYELHFTKDGVAQDITGWKVFFTVKEHPDDPDDDAVIKEDVIVHTNPTAGITQINLSAEKTGSLSPTPPDGLYHYDIQIKDTSGNIVTVMIGRIGILEKITQRN